MARWSWEWGGCWPARSSGRVTSPFSPGASTLSTWPPEQSRKSGPTGGLTLRQPLEAATGVGAMVSMVAKSAAKPT